MVPDYELPKLSHRPSVNLVLADFSAKEFLLGTSISLMLYILIPSAAVYFLVRLWRSRSKK